MATIPNTFQAQTPIGQSLSNLGTALFGNTMSPTERQKQALENRFLRARIGAEEAETRQAAAVMSGQRTIADILGEAQRSRQALSAPDASSGFVGPLQPQRTAELANAQTQLTNTPLALARAGSAFTEDPQDLANLFNFAQANDPRVRDTAVLRSLAGRGALPTQNTAVSVAGQNRIATRNAALKPGEPFTETNLLDANTGEFVGVGFVNRTNGQVFDQSGNPVSVGPQADGRNIVLAGKPSIQASEAGGLPGADKTELRQVREDVFSMRAKNEQALGLINELQEITQREGAATALGSVGRISARLSGLRAQVADLFKREGVQIETDLNPANFQDQLQAIGAGSAEAQSAIIDLAFAIATAREGRRLTDQDIARSLETLGASQSDPALFRVALRRTANRIIRDDRITRRVASQRFATNPAAIPNIRALQDLQSPFGAGSPTGGGAGAGAKTPQEMSDEELLRALGGG